VVTIPRRGSHPGRLSPPTHHLTDTVVHAENLDLATNPTRKFQAGQDRQLTITMMTYAEFFARVDATEYLSEATTARPTQAPITLELIPIAAPTTTLNPAWGQPATRSISWDGAATKPATKSIWNLWKK
jgi:hypothetical protein